MSDDELMQRYQEAMRHAEPPGEAAPDPELLRRVARGEVPERERLRVLDIVMQSEKLRREYDTFRVLAAAGRPAAFAWPRRLAAAALITVVAGVSYWALSAPKEEASWRGGASGVVPIAPTDRSEVSAPLHLVWHSLPEATEYQIEIIEENGRLVAAFETSDTMFVVPSEAGLRGSTPYRWGVSARGALGESGHSPLHRFTLRD